MYQQTNEYSSTVQHITTWISKYIKNCQQYHLFTAMTGDKIALAELYEIIQINLFSHVSFLKLSNCKWKGAFLNDISQRSNSQIPF